MASKVKIILLASTFIGGSLVKPDGEPVLVDEAIAKDLCDRGVAYKDGERVQATTSNGLEKLEAEIIEKDNSIKVLTEQNELLAKEVDELKAEKDNSIKVLTEQNGLLSKEIEKLKAEKPSDTTPTIVNKKLTGN